MSHTERMDVSEEERPMFDEVRRNYEPAHVAGLYEALREVQRMRFKDSFKKKMREIFPLNKNSIQVHARIANVI